MVEMSGQLPSILLVFVTFLSGTQGFSCPAYDSIATQRVAASSFSLDDVAGEWYLVGTSEPTLPPFCTCPKLHWFVDSDSNIKQYHYKMTAHCATINFTATLKGEARDPSRPGLLSENLAVYNHSVAPYCPHMIYDIQTMSDGNLVGFTYACLLGRGSAVNMFSFNIVAKKPTLTIHDLKGLVAKQSERTGGVLKVHGIRYSDRSVCSWGAGDVIV
mmetsp:Transcript_98284/g.174187  ORF Transcript_98284/g.174187 Transcript_98284/m.174187 type:complete len:216 (-) Transcript_98284:116-763(-)